MSTFINGPAHGVQLQFSRTPLLLRVVLNAQGQWDVLDKIEDTPAADETIYVYRLRGVPMRGFWDGRDKAGKRTGGMFSIAEYHYVEDQPTDAEVRDTLAWQNWTRAQPEATGLWPTE